MIGLDFPVKPEWVYDVLHLWQPNQPVSELINAALSKTMQELGGEKTRRNSLSIILRNFVTIEGGGNSRHTVNQDVWVAFSQHYSVGMMSPAYLAKIIAQNDVAQDATKYIMQRYSLGDTLHRADLKRYIIGRYGERKVVTNTVSAFLRSLQYFGILSPGDKQGEYIHIRQLSVSQEVFPLVVWSWWCANPRPQIELEVFRNSPALAFSSSEYFLNYWKAFQPNLWVISERLDKRFVMLQETQSEKWKNTLISLIGQV
ncbi:hypothetical protein ACFLV7_08545 [Chloroflexota bacterium]